MNRSLISTAVLAALLVLSACDTYEQDDYADEIVVEAYLAAGEPLPEVKVSRTAPIDRFYRFEDFAVDDASVVVSLLDEAGGVEARYPYVRAAEGRYRPAGQAVAVQPLRRYALEVDVPGEAGTVRASTLVPGGFRVLDFTADTVRYQGTEQFQARVTRSDYPGRQSYYIFTLVALDTSFGLTPFYADFVGDDDDDAQPEDFMRNASGLSNEANFDPNPDGTLTMRLPWVAIAFYGPNEIVANALDDNLYDFLRSRLQGGTRSPGEMDNLLDHVDGGRGIFGSMARDSFTVFIQRTPD